MVFTYIKQPSGCYVENDYMGNGQSWKQGHQLGGCHSHVEDDGAWQWQRKGSKMDRLKKHGNTEPRPSILPFVTLPKGSAMCSEGYILTPYDSWLFPPECKVLYYRPASLCTDCLPVCRC